VTGHDPFPAHAAGRVTPDRRFSPHVYLPATTVLPTVVAIRSERAETFARAQPPDLALTRAVTNQCKDLSQCISRPPKRSLQTRRSDSSARDALQQQRGSQSAVACRVVWPWQLGSGCGPLCRITRPGPRPLAGQEVNGAPGDAADVSRSGSDRWRCPCWLGF